jgi:hypothetical protein
MSLSGATRIRSFGVVSPRARLLIIFAVALTLAAVATSLVERRAEWRHALPVDPAGGPRQGRRH